MPRGRSLEEQIKWRLHPQLAIGQSKYLDKMMLDGHADKNKIYSWSTYNNYLKHALAFANWCHNTYGCNSLKQCRKHTQEYIDSRSHLSPWTLKLDVASLAKVYHEDGRDIAVTPARERQKIKRSRHDVAYDRHINRSHWEELYAFAESTGLRRMELQCLRGNHIIEHDSKFYIVVDSGSKGGRYREAEIVGNQEQIARVVDRVRNTPADEKVFDRLPSGMDCHGCRRIYAQKVYDLYKQDVSTLSKKEIYICRKDSHKVFCKKSMEITSKMLGHTRISVIAQSYLQ